MWTPDELAMGQLKQIIQGTLSANNRERKLANEAFLQAKQQPEIENYLFHILVVDTSARSDVRAAAGINLKNILRRHKGDRQYVLDNISNGLMSEDNMVRNITGNVITSLFSIYGLEKWPQALTNLIELSTSSNTLAAEAAMSALTKICEDSFYKLDVDFNGERPLDFLISNFIKLLDHSSGKIRAMSIQCVNFFIPLKSQSILVVLDYFLEKLFSLAHDPFNDVKKNICKSFQAILEARGDKLLPHLEGVVNYCLHLMQDDDEEVALEAAEFLLALSASPEFETHKLDFAPKLNDILPVLLSKMVYSEEQIFFMRLVDDDTNVADNEDDIKPQMAKSKESHKASKAKRQAVDDGDDSDSDFYDEEEEDDELEEWSIRKCSAATLDLLSTHLPEQVLHVTLPVLQGRIISPHWEVREAAILAFGAIAKSCIELSRDKLPELVPFLVDRLQDDEPRVRQITCWTISRYSLWVAEEAHEGGQYANYFDPTFESILKCSLDNKKVVQESACSALCSFIEETDPDIIGHYVVPLLQNFTKCLEIYQKKNMIILYDAIQTFIEAMGYERLSTKQEFINVLLPQLLSKWQALADDDTELWPLLECMASVAATLKELFAPYALPIYERAVKILHSTIQTDLQCQTDPSIDLPEKDFMVTSLDLIDGLVQGFESHSVDLIHGNLVELLLQCFEDTTDDVRQSAYALLGDLAIFVLEVVLPYLDQTMVCIGHEINSRTFSSYPVCNNAIWALGEICLRLPHEKIKPFLANFVDLLVPVLNSMDTQQTVLENAAICLGRMGIHTESAAIIAPRLPEFIVQWCSQMIYTMENEEKSTSFQGMLNIISANPDHGFGNLATPQGKKNLSIFISTVANYMEPPAELKSLFSQLLSGYANLLGDGYNDVLKHLDPDTRSQLYNF